MSTLDELKPQMLYYKSSFKKGFKSQRVCTKNIFNTINRFLKAEDYEYGMFLSGYIFKLHITDISQYNNYIRSLLTNVTQLQSASQQFTPSN
jgi:hypothetical protein